MRDNLVKELRKSIRWNRTYEKEYHIYLVGDSAIAKGRSERSSKAEYKWGTYLYENEVKVPEMYSLVSPDSLISRVVHIRDSIKEWYVMMERLRGEDMGNLSGSAREEAIRQYRQELEKVLELGICANDSDWGGNAIFGENGRLYLIDFESWQKGSKSELNRFYKRIKNPEIQFR